MQLLNSDHVRERDKALLRGVLVGGVWNGFLLGKVKNCHVLCRFCGSDDNDGHLFWDCTFPPLVEIRENPEFHELMEMDKSCWPRCLLWHGWLPMLSGVNQGSPWALNHAEGASNLLESALGSYTSAFLLDWRLPGGFDAESAALHVAREPDVWTDGSMVEDKVSAVSSSGAGFSSGRAGRFWAERSWGHIDDDVQEDRTVASCRGYCSVPGPLQSVQRAELWGVILALQASCGVHLGVDNLNVVRHVGRLLDGGLGARPFEIVKDGDLLCLIDRMLQLRGLDTVKISKVKGHADDGMVLDGRVRDLDRLGNNAADEAADFGRRRVPVHVIDARRNLVGVCSRWYPVVRHLHRFFLLLLLGLLLIMMMTVVLRRTLLFGLLDLYPRGPGFFMLFVTLLFYLVLLVFGMGIGCLLVSVVSLLRMLGYGLILCLFLLRCRPFWALCIGRLVLLSLVLGVFHLLKCSFCMSCGLVKDFVLRVLFLGIGGLDVQFQCRLFLLVQALIFGAPVGFLEPSFVHCVCCLVVLVGFSLGILGLIMVAFDTLVGKSAVMVLRPGHVRLLLFGFWMSFSFFSGIQLPLVLICLQGPCLLGITLRVLLVGSLLGACLRVAMLLVFLPLGNWFVVVLVLCLLRWVVLVFAWLEVLVEALKESDYTEKHQHTLLDRVFRGSRFVPGFGRDLGIHRVLILVFLVLSF